MGTTVFIPNMLYEYAYRILCVLRVTYVFIYNRIYSNKVTRRASLDGIHSHTVTVNKQAKPSMDDDKRMTRAKTDIGFLKRKTSRNHTNLKRLRHPVNLLK